MFHSLYIRYQDVVQPQSCLLIRDVQERFEELKRAYPGSRLLIVSNSAGTLSDPTGAEADLLEKATGVKVLRHTTKVQPLPELGLHSY